MGNLKNTFAPNTIILSAEMNQNFTRIMEQDQTEDISSQADGIKTQFTLTYNYVSGTIKAYVDGLRVKPGDVQEDGTNLFTFLFASPLESGVEIVIDYVREY